MILSDREIRAAVDRQAGTKVDTFTLKDGQVILRWPGRIRLDEYPDLEAWLQLMIRKVKRSVREYEPPGEE